MKSGFAAVVHKANEDVQFFWAIACAAIDNVFMNFILGRLVHSYVALRGQAFAAQWMEQHKHRTKRCVEKTRSFRSRFQTLT